MESCQGGWHCSDIKIMFAILLTKQLHDKGLLSQGSGTWMGLYWPYCQNAFF